MTQRFNYPFRTVRGTTAPSFEAGATDVFASTALALESTSLGRVWQGPSSRSVRLAERAGIDYHVNFGSSDVVAASSDSILVLGGNTHVFAVESGQSHIAVLSVSTSTGARVNVTPGYGGR